MSGEPGPDIMWTCAFTNAAHSRKKFGDIHFHGGCCIESAGDMTGHIKYSMETNCVLFTVQDM